ncbi:hypothetical protein ACNSOL_01355 [Aliarcobacter lanthieri]|uniref:hypothetical protein n=1 Tax=Aliarcobacter lanthieri TaxID=1355374 RepID=UPI003AACF44C
MRTEGNRYIGGGKIFFTPIKKDGTLGDEFEIGECQTGELNFNVEKKEAFSKDRVIKQLVEQVVTNIDATFKFTTQKVNNENLVLAKMGVKEEITYAVGDTLPDGTIATSSGTYTKIKMAENPIQKGQLKFIGDEDGDSKPVLILFSVALAPSTGFNYFTDDFATLEFEAAVLKTDDGYGDEFWMKVGE